MVSMFNLSATFLVVCVLGSSFATPLPSPAGEVSTSPSHNAILEHQLQESWKNFSRSSEWVFYRLQQIVRSVLEDGLENIATWALDLVLRCELFMIADGSHLMVPLSDKTGLEEEYKVTATAVSKLMRNLKTMERTDLLLTRVVKNWVEDYETHTKVKDYKSTEKLFRTALHEYFKSVDHMFLEDAELGEEYKKQFSKAKEDVKKNPKVREPLYKFHNGQLKPVDFEATKSFLQDKVIFGQVVANKIFLKGSVKNLFMIFSQKEHKRYVMARALLQEAATAGYEAKINEIYERALTKAGEIELASENDQLAMDELFATVEKGLEAEPELKKKIYDLVKEIETKTAVYDIDMMHLDFSVI